MNERNPNLRVTVQGVNKDLVNFVIFYLREECGDKILFEVGLKKNSREPFVGGVHDILFLYILEGEKE